MHPILRLRASLELVVVSLSVNCKSDVENTERREIRRKLLEQLCGTTGGDLASGGAVAALNKWVACLKSPSLVKAK